MAAEWFRMPIVLESDCVMVIRYLKEWRTLKPACFSTIQEAVRIAKSLPDLELCHVKRERNGVANELAHLAKRLNHSACGTIACLGVLSRSLLMIVTHF